MLMIAVVFIDIEKVSRKQCYDDETKTKKMGKSIGKDKMTGLTHNKCSDQRKSRKGLRCCAGPSLNMSFERYCWTINHPFLLVHLCFLVCLVAPNF